MCVTLIIINNNFSIHRWFFFLAIQYVFMHVLCFFLTNDEECSVSVGSFINMYEYFMFNVQLSLICWSLSWEDLGLHRPTKSSQQRNTIHMFTTAWLFRYDEVIRLKTTTKTEISIFVGAQWVTGAVGVEDVNCSLFEQRLLYSRLNIDGTPGSFQDISILPSSPSCLLCLIFSPSSLPVRLSFPPCVETVPRLLESVTDSSPRKLPSFSFFFFLPPPVFHTHPPLTHAHFTCQICAPPLNRNCYIQIWCSLPRCLYWNGWTQPSWGHFLFPVPRCFITKGHNCWCIMLQFKLDKKEWGWKSRSC